MIVLYEAISTTSSMKEEPGLRVDNLLSDSVGGYLVTKSHKVQRRNLRIQSAIQNVECRDPTVQTLPFEFINVVIHDK